jgi:hypothetical protein
LCARIRRTKVAVLMALPLRPQRLSAVGERGNREGREYPREGYSYRMTLVDVRFKLPSAGTSLDITR